MCEITIVYDEVQEIPQDILEEEETEPVDYAKIIFHVTSESFGYFDYHFRANNTGDFIRINAVELGIEPNLCDSSNTENSTDTNLYVRISKSRYVQQNPREHVRDDTNGTFVKILGVDNGLIVLDDEPVMINIHNVQRYSKNYTVYKNGSTWNRNVNRLIKVPLEFGSHLENNITYTALSNRGANTSRLLRTLYNYNNNNELVDYGDGTRFKNFGFRQKNADEDGNYIQETINGINNHGDKWSPDSGTASAASIFNRKAYFTYKVYIYRSDDTDRENALTAHEKLDNDLTNTNRNNAVKGTNNEPIIWEVGRHTRTNNFSYYRKGGSMPPTGEQGQPEYYEINWKPDRFRVVLPEEEHSNNFRTNNPGYTLRYVEIQTNNNKIRDGISLDKYSSSDDVEGCLAMLGRLENGIYISMADANMGWIAWGNLLIDLIPELDEVFGRTGHQDINVDTAETRTRVFMKVDPLPDIEPEL